MKLITFTIPCYNAAGHMRRSIDSILNGRGSHDIEIIIINDGSKDDTGAVADAYVREYPDIVTAVHQENGGHGEGVNQGILRAKGLFFKVVDSDDWLDTDSLRLVLDTLSELSQNAAPTDMIICNYSRVMQSTNKARQIRYHSVLPEGRIFGWNEIGKFALYQNLMMHALIFRTELLRECHLTLPKHTFYVDCLFSHLPLYRVKTLYYINTSLYQYLVGQASQSVNKSSVIRNIDHMLRVVKLMIEGYLAQTAPLDPKLNVLQLDDIYIMLVNVSTHLILANTPEADAKKVALWAWLRDQDAVLYAKMRRRFAARVLTRDNRVARSISRIGFATVDRLFKVN